MHDGRIDQLAVMRFICNANTCAEVREHVAAVMRADPRRDDSVSLAEGDGLTIIVPCTDEELDQRARCAFDPADAQGDVHVVSASEIEQICCCPLLLRSPLPRRPDLASGRNPAPRPSRRILRPHKLRPDVAGMRQIQPVERGQRDPQQCEILARGDKLRIIGLHPLEFGWQA